MSKKQAFIDGLGWKEISMTWECSAKNGKMIEDII